MKTLFILIGMFFFCVVAEAQVILNTQPAGNTGNTVGNSKFDRTVNKANTAVNNTSNTVKNTTSTLSNVTDQVKAFAGKIGAMLPKRKNHESAPAGSVNTTVVTIKGASFSKLEALNDKVKACSGVQATKIKFNGSRSVITVTHSGSTSKLLKQIERKSKSIFTAANVSDFKEGSVSINLNL